MVKKLLIKKTRKGFGLFASKNFKKDEKILQVDLTKLRKYNLKEIGKLPESKKIHSDFIGNGKYVIGNSIASYINHSCNPNCYAKMNSMTKRDIYALRDIDKGEELTHDYTATSIDQFAGEGFWKFKCNCGSKYCRKVIHGDFFKMPKKWQQKYYSHLPQSIKRKYKNLFRK